MSVSDANPVEVSSGAFAAAGSFRIVRFRPAPCQMVLDALTNWPQ